MRYDLITPDGCEGSFSEMGEAVVVAAVLQLPHFAVVRRAPGEPVLRYDEALADRDRLVMRAA